MKRSARKQEIESGHGAGCLNPLIPVICAALIISRFTSSFFPGARLWGINHLAYFPLHVGILLTLASLLLLIPKMNYRIQNWLALLVDPIHRRTFGESKKLWFVIFSLASFPFFWIFRTRTHFLGDSYQIIGDFQSSNFFVKWSELGESLIHIHLYKLLNSVLTIEPRVFYELSSCFLGVIFIYLVFVLADFLGQNKAEKVFLFLLVAFMGSIQLFCGYIENYSLAYLLMFAFILSGLKYLKGDGKTFVPVLLFVLAVFSHVSSSYFLPAVFVLYLLGPRKNGESSFSLGKNRFALLFLVVFTFVIYFYMKEYSWMVGNKFVPLFKGDYYGPGYSLFSPPHLLDIINQQLLVTPVGLLLLASVWICTGSFNLKDRSVLFLSVVFLLGMGFNFVMYPGLGMPRDWDMFSSTSVGYTVLAAALFLKLADKGVNFKYTGSILVITAVFCTLPWVLLNASEQRGVERFRHVLDLDPKKSRSGHYILAGYFDKKGMVAEMHRENQIQAEQYPELSLVNQGFDFLNRNQLDQAMELGRKALEIEPDLAEARLLFGKIYEARGYRRQAEREFKLARDLKPGEGKVLPEGSGFKCEVFQRLQQPGQPLFPERRVGPGHPFVQKGAENRS